MVKTIRFYLNSRLVETNRPHGSILVDFIRGEQRHTGTKIGCREGECGACTVLLGKTRCAVFSYKAVASCLMALGQVNGAHVITIEGLNPPVGLNPIQQAFVDFGATQCGFCTPGFILSLTGFFCSSAELSLEDAFDSVDGNICRCTGYESIRKAIRFLLETVGRDINTGKPRLQELMKAGILPESFSGTEEKLNVLHPKSREEAEEEAVLVAGATDLLVQNPEKLLRSKLRFLEPPEYAIREDKGRIVIAGTVTVSLLRQDPVIGKYLTKIKEQSNRISSTLMRNRATIAGNIVNASPIGDLSVMFLALDGELSIRKGEAVRTKPLRKFFTGYKEYDLAGGEIIEEISIPVLESDARFAFDKVAMRRYLDIASCNAAVFLRYEGEAIHTAGIAAGGVAAYPLFLKQASAVLEGQPLSAELLQEAVNTALSEIKPIDDIRGTAGYKRLLLRQILFGLFLEIFSDKISFEELMR